MIANVTKKPMDEFQLVTKWVSSIQKYNMMKDIIAEVSNTSTKNVVHQLEFSEEEEKDDINNSRVDLMNNDVGWKVIPHKSYK